MDSFPLALRNALCEGLAMDELFPSMIVPNDMHTWTDILDKRSPLDSIHSFAVRFSDFNPPTPADFRFNVIRVMRSQLEKVESHSISTRMGIFVPLPSVSYDLENLQWNIFLPYEATFVDTERVDAETLENIAQIEWEIGDERGYESDE